MRRPCSGEAADEPGLPVADGTAVVVGLVQRAGEVEDDGERQRGGDVEGGVPERGEVLVRQAGEELGLPVLVQPLGFHRVEHRLLGRVGLRTDEVEDRLPKGTERCEVGFGVGPAVADEQPGDGLEVPFLRDERCGRREPDDRRCCQLAGSGRGEFPVYGEYVVRLVGAPGGEATGDGGADLVQPEGEAGDDAEVAATAAQRPEQIRVLGPVRRPDPSVRGDDLDLFQVVGCPAEAARQVAESAAEGEAGDSGLGHEAEHRRQPVLLGRPVDVPQQAARTCVRETGGRVHGDLAHAGHVEGHPAVGECRAGDVVAAALDAQQQAVVRGEPHDGGHVLGRDRLDDQHGCRGDHGVPDQDGLVPALVPGREQRAPEPGAEVLDASGGQADAPAVESGDLEHLRRHADSSCSDPPVARAALSAVRSAFRNASGCSAAGSSRQSSITCSGQPYRALAACAVRRRT